MKMKMKNRSHRSNIQIELVYMLNMLNIKIVAV